MRKHCKKAQKMLKVEIQRSDEIDDLIKNFRSVIGAELARDGGSEKMPIPVHLIKEIQQKIKFVSGRQPILERALASAEREIRQDSPSKADSYRHEVESLLTIRKDMLRRYSVIGELIDQAAANATAENLLEIVRVMDGQNRIAENL